MTNRTSVRGLHSVASPADGTSVLDALAGAYERGWQPADIMHATRRSLGAGEVRLAVWAIRYEAAMSKAEDRAPEQWLRQLRAIAEIEARPGPDGSSSLQRTAVTQLWRYLPRLAPECARPSTWPERRTEPTAPRVGVDPKVLARIRALLAKAESTEFAEEAETFTAKAQEFMTKYAITAALLQANADTSAAADVHTRRVHLESPYVKEKALLLSEIASTNRVRTVWFDKLAIATCVGTAIDLEQTDLLFTSLLVQVTRAMADAARRAVDSGDSGSVASFRRAFLYGFAVRIGQRLRMTGTSATAQAAAEADIAVSAVLPVLARQSAAVDAEFERLFPATKPTRTAPVDSAGWYAGQAAAERASLRGNDHVEGRRQAG